MRQFRWSNIPIPEGHVVLLAVGIALQWWFPLALFQDMQPAQILGAAVVLAAILLAAWAVFAVNSVDTDKPSRIITMGPYAYSRNPMYVAWTLIYLGAALLVNTWWLFLLLPVLLIYTHYFVVRKEERELEQRFGDEYREYCARVRRYL